MELSFNELVLAVNGEVLVDNENRTFNDVNTDTRKIEKNNIFIALNGENFNGNKYAKDALEKGASIVIVDEVIEDIQSLNGLGIVIKVKNTYDALLDLAHYYRTKLGIKVVGVTGSTGKTSTKDLVAAFLSEKYKVFKTKGNFNNEVGLPLMIFQLDSTYDVAVLELGMSDLGEIHRLAKCSRPDIALITNIGLSHLENLKTRENILKAKMEITDFFTNENVLIVNAEDDYLPNVESDSYKVIKTGYDEKYLFSAKDVELSNKETSFTLVSNEGEYRFDIPMVGAHNVLNALLGIAACRELNVSYEDMIKGLDSLEATSMRLQFIEKDKFTIINDCYNASPDSMKAALDVLNNIDAKGRKIAVLGDMNELGSASDEAHREVGKYAKDRADILISTGKQKENYKIGFEKDSAKLYNSKEELIDNIKNIVKEGDVIIVKASRGVKFEEIVKALENLDI